MTAIGKGDFVEFVGKPDGYTSPPGASVAPAIGSVFRVTEVGRRCRDGAGRAWPSIRVSGLPSALPSGEPVSWPVACFKPVSGGKPGMFDEFLKAPTDAPNREPVAA